MEQRKKSRINTVKSGIGLSALQGPELTSTAEPVVAEKFITSRTARVFLAGAGFLADAVSLVLCIYFFSDRMFLVRFVCHQSGFATFER